MIKIDNLKKTYNPHSRFKKEVLHGISLELPNTGFIAILGSSGCGKTTLLNAVGGLDSFDEGCVCVDGVTVSSSPCAKMEEIRNSSFGYIFQNYYLLSEHSVAYNVYLGMHSLELSHEEKLRRVKNSLERVNMLRYSKRLVSELSGGQQQRVAIARAIARQPRVIFADEPTGNLDEANTVNICNILKELSRDSLVVMVTHEERIARFFADRIITLDDGVIKSDSTEWDRSSLNVRENDAVYAGDYTEARISTDMARLRVLSKDGALPAELTIVIEDSRIIIKLDDPRAVISSESAAPPRLKEGKSPVISTSQAEAVPANSDKPMQEICSKGGRLPWKMLFAEARALVSGGKRLKRFGMGVFIILLSLMISLFAADFIAIKGIDPEAYITADSHTLDLSFERGTGVTNKYQPILTNIDAFRTFLDNSGCDFDYIPATNDTLFYVDSTIPQYEEAHLEMKYFSRANINRLDSQSIIIGRMPTRSDEIVIDRWVIDKLLADDGIIQNIIPNASYLVGKELICRGKSMRLKIVGICDSGEPTMYMSTEALLAFGTYGSEVITLSEYIRITGDSSVSSLGQKECIAIMNNATGLNDWNSVQMYIGSNYRVTLHSTLTTDSDISAKLIISDDALSPLYRSMIDAADTFHIWSEDKTKIRELIDTGMPEELSSVLVVKDRDIYGEELDRHNTETKKRLDSRLIVTITVVLACMLMLYLMQRSKIRERMDLIAVYRLLGISNSSLLSIFAIESILLTLRFAVPTVFCIWGAIKAVSLVEFFDSTALVFPIWAAALTLLSIAAYRLIISVIPAIRIILLPPARIASSFDL